MKRQLLSTIFAMLLILTGLGVAKADDCPAPGMEPEEAVDCFFALDIKVSIAGRGLSSGRSQLFINGMVTTSGALINLSMSAPTSEEEGALSDCLSLALQATKGDKRLRLRGTGDYTLDTVALVSNYSVFIDGEAPDSMSCQLI